MSKKLEQEVEKSGISVLKELDLLLAEIPDDSRRANVAEALDEALTHIANVAKEDAIKNTSTEELLSEVISRCDIPIERVDKTGGHEIKILQSLSPKEE